MAVVTAAREESGVTSPTNGASAVVAAVLPKVGNGCVFWTALRELVAGRLLGVILSSAMWDQNINRKTI